MAGKLRDERQNPLKMPLEKTLLFRWFFLKIRVTFPKFKGIKPE
jgi:hypothetical protein